MTNRPTILITDDSEMNREILKEILGTYYPESYILVTRFPRSWRNISRRHGITS